MPTLTEETRALRREKLIRAAARCFSRTGYRGTSVRDIAREAGVTTGAIYAQFEGKEDLLCALAATFEAVREDAFRPPAEEVAAPDAVAQSLTRLTEYLDGDDRETLLRSDIVMLAEGLSVPPLRDLMVRADLQHFHAYQTLLDRNRHWRKDVDGHTLARVVTGSVFGLLILTAYHSDIDRGRYIACLRALVAGAMDEAARGAGADTGDGRHP